MDVRNYYMEGCLHGGAVGQDVLGRICWKGFEYQC